MGLDVYLRYCDNWPEKLRLEKEFSNEVEEKSIAWDSPEYIALNEKLGLVDGQYPSDEEVEISSNLYPEHMFKIGYFRSSYNASGLNRILRTRTGKDLYWVFEGSTDYEFVPDWQDAAYRISLLINEFTDAIAETGNYEVFQVSTFIENKEINSDKTALDIFMREANRPNTLSAWYSNKEGHYIPEGITVKGIINGWGHFDRPAVYVIYESEKDWSKWYMEALEIVQETILWVLDSEEPNNYGLLWSA